MSDKSTSQEKPYRGIEVIGAGWGRTGTNSLMKALEILGYDPCYHMEKVIEDGTGEVWAKIYQQKPYNFVSIFGPKKYRATTDFPSCMFWKEQLDQYPDAKVILTTRDPEKWYKSCMSTIFNAMPGNPHSPLGMKVCNFLGLGPIGSLSREIVNRVFNSRTADKEFCIKIFNEHNQKVIQECPKEKLLVFQVEQGWAPLCEFLGCPIPDVPFPHVNDTKQFQRHIAGVNRLGYGIFAAMIALAVGAIYGISRFGMRLLSQGEL